MVQLTLPYPIRLVVYCSDRDDRIKTLLRERSGFKVFEAQTLSDAYLKAQSECCHVAIVEYEEINKNSRAASEEIFESLAKNFHFAHICVLCGPSIPTRMAKSAHDAGIRLLHFGKRDLERLSDEIFSIAIGLRLNNLAVEWDPKPGTYIPTLFNRKEEVDWVFSNLLPRASKFRVYELVGRGNSGVIRGRIDDLAIPALIKIGPATKIKQETDNFDNYIYHQLGATYHAFIEQKYYAWWNIGGILYTSLGENKDVVSFSSYYNLQGLRGVPQIRTTLDFLYDTVLRPLYRGINQRMLHESLYDNYDKSFQLSDRLVNFNPPEIGFGLPDPINWLKSNKASSYLQRQNILTYEAITHGDLWGENILVDGSRCWVIDYERTGWGHILRDFVELEVDIFSRLSQIPESELGIVYDLAVALSKPSSVLNHLPYWSPLIQYHVEAQKAFWVIGRIRHHADRIAQYQDMREYYWALLLDALFLATLQWKPPWQRKRAFLLASVLCGRLEYWGKEDWPPSGWQKVEWIPAPVDINVQSPIRRLSSEYQQDDNESQRKETGGNVTNIRIGNITIGEGSKVGDIVLASEIQKSFNKAESSNIQDELKEALKQLAEAVNTMNKQLPAAQAAETAEDLARLVDEATKPAPNQKWYSVSIEGLIKAAQNVEKVGEPVINLSSKVLSLLMGGILPS